MFFIHKFTANSVVLLALTSFIVGIAIVFKNPLLVYTAVFFVTLNVVLYVWAQHAVRGLSISREVQRLAVARQKTQVELKLTNLRKSARFGALGFDMHREVTPGRDYSAVAFLEAPGGESVSSTYTITPARRGVFQAGPVYLYGGDPFGFYKCWRRIDEYSRMIVLPSPFSFRFTNPASRSELALDEMATIAAGGDSTEFFGVREYVPGEPLKRVHWRSSARLGKLISKQFEMNVASSVSALLLVDGDMYRGTSVDNPLEYSITMIASLAYATCSERFHFSYLNLIGEKHESFAGTGLRFYQEMAVRLAQLKGQGEVRWEEASRLILNYLPKSSSLIVFVADINETAQQRLRLLAGHFASVSVVTFNRRSFERSTAAAESSRLHFGDGYLIHEVVYGEDLGRILEQVLANASMLRRK
jgi:uncharacterized protein (DUF58 family)